MARQETGRVSGTSIIHNLTNACLTEFGNAEYSLETMEWLESREKREKKGKAENVQKNVGKIMGNMTENYRGDNERKTQNENLEEAK